MSLFPDPMKALKSIKHAATAVVHGKVKKAAHHVAVGVNEVTRAHVVQAVFPAQAIPKAIVSAAIAHGPKGALDAAHEALKNPVMKGKLMAGAVVFPPLAPLSAAGIGGMEASSRLLDAAESKDPKAAAAAAMQLAATAVAAKDGIAGAARAKQSLTELGSARAVWNDLQKGAPKAQEAVAMLKKAAAAGDKRAKAGIQTLEFVAARAHLKGQAPKKVGLTAHRESPSLLAATAAAINAPSGIRVGDFSVLRTGRILHKGKALRFHGKKH